MRLKLRLFIFGKHLVKQSMGNSSSKETRGGMVVQTDHSYYFSGSHLTGKIYVDIYQSFPARKLSLEVKGKEKCEWVEHKTRNGNEGETETYDVWHKKSHDIFKFEQLVYQFPGGYIPAGQYVFPFSFKLPDN